MNVALISAERPVFSWTGFGGIPDDIAKGEWFEDPSGKMRKAYDDIEAGWVPWLDPHDIGAFKYPPQFPASSPVNLSGIHPQEFKVLVCPDPVEEKTKGGIILAAQTAEAEKYATTQGRIIDMAPAAWTFINKEEWGDGKPPVIGDRVIFAKYAGLRVTSKRDGKDYLLMADKDILATIED